MTEQRDIASRTVPGTAPQRTAAALCSALFAIGCGGADEESSTTEVEHGPPWFEERTDLAGIDFVHDSGHQEGIYRFPEGVCGGACLFDYDGDGDLDLYFVQGGRLDVAEAERPKNVLYRNRGDGTFEDVTAQAGVGDGGYGMGCTSGDYDADGDVDLYVTNVGTNVLYRNEGDGSFTNVTAAAGVGDPSFGSSCAFLDYDGDADLDLFVVNYVNWSLDRDIECYVSGRRDYCSPNAFSSPASDRLFRNEGDGSFTDVSDEAGLGAAFGNGLGLACADFDLDGHVDIYVANDAMPNQLWMNDGHGGFTDRGLISGSALNQSGAAEAGMGVALGDVNQDGQLDLLVSHLEEETNTLYMNKDGMFRDATAVVGLAAASTYFTGFGVGFADFDNDGALDLYVANGRVKRGARSFDPDDPYAEPNQVYRGLGDGRFEELMPRGGTAPARIATSRGAAFGDLDGDGDVDVVVLNRDDRPDILLNVAGAGGQSVSFRVLGRNGIDSIGARLRIDAGDRNHWRTVNPAYGYCSANDARVHCGLGTAKTVDRVVVRWPNGDEESFGPFPAGGLHELRQGTGS